MRQAINENKTVQIVIVGVMLVATGLLLVTRMGGGGGETTPPAAPTASDAVSGATGDPTASATPAAPPAGATEATSTAVPAPGAPPEAAATAPGAAPAGAAQSEVTPAALVPGPGLPAPVKAAWNRGDAIVLLIVRGGAADDRLVRRSVQAISSPGVAVFVARAKQIARYSRITQSVGVNQVPALVVVRPKGVSGAVPQAMVSYGFRSAQSVAQAVRDALYSGRDDLPYNPG